jgi:hypothetical protein
VLAKQISDDQRRLSNNPTKILIPILEEFDDFIDNPQGEPFVLPRHRIFDGILIPATYLLWVITLPDHSHWGEITPDHIWSG